MNKLSPVSFANSVRWKSLEMGSTRSSIIIEREIRMGDAHDWIGELVFGRLGGTTSDDLVVFIRVCHLFRLITASIIQSTFVPLQRAAYPEARRSDHCLLCRRIVWVHVNWSLRYSTTNDKLTGATCLSLRVIPVQRLTCMGTTMTMEPNMSYRRESRVGVFNDYMLGALTIWS